MPRLSHYFFLILLLVSGSLSAAPTSDYTTLKKFLTARMYTEAYFELLKCELANKSEDPRLSKLKKDLLANTRKEATSRAKVKTDDPLVFTVLADVDYQEGQLESGISQITKALNGDSGSITNHIFAKLLFSKGNLPQAAEAMEKALAADPGLETVFEDFQFLYNCKNYGLAAAKRLTPNAGFLARAQQVSASGGPPTPPESPFENDPTRPPEIITPPDPDPDPLVNAQTPVQPQQPANTGGTDKPPLPPIDVNPPDDTDPIIPPDKTPLSFIASAGEPADPVARPEEDPEQKKIKEAENLLAHARRKFKDQLLEDAEDILKKARKLFPEIIGADELQKQIDDKRKVRKDFKLAISLYDNQKFDLAREAILKAYTDEPEKYPEAPFYLGKIFLLGEPKDLKKARKYFDIYLNSDKTDPELKRDVEWVVIGILADDGEFEEAYKQFNDFTERETEYAKNRETYWKLKRRLWYLNYQTAIHIGLACFFGAFVLVFFLMVIPSFGIFVRDPVAKAKKAFAAKNYAKAVQIAEDFLKRAKHPVQIQRQLLEVCIESHFHLKNFFKCQSHGKELLQIFPDNMVAWNFLAKAYVETNDSSDEAITIFETLYKKNPENKQYLPTLCKYYASHKQFTVESLEIMHSFFQKEPGNKDNVLALANGMVQTKRLSEEVIPVLLEALKLQPKNLDFRELLARNYSKKNQYAEAVKECLQVFDGNINNMGIHVVYTTCMKKMNMLEEAVLQYEDFIRKNPRNAQIVEIVTGLRKELEQIQRSTTSPSEGLSPFSDDMISEGLPGRTGVVADHEIGLEGFVEPPPEGFIPDVHEVPLPDFLKADRAESNQASEFAPISENSPSSFSTVSTNPHSGDLHEIPTLDPFSMTETGEPGTPVTEARLPLRKPASPPPVVSPSEPEPEINLEEEEPERDLRTSKSVPASQPTPVIFTGAMGTADLDDCRLKLQQKKSTEVIAALAPVFAGQRSKPVGILLADAYLQSKQAELAKEILENIDCDWEIMSDDLKDVCYRVGKVLEEQKKIAEALALYDKICNVDIDFRDTFDRSDRLYTERKKKKQ